MLDALVQEGVRALVHRRLHLLGLEEAIQLLWPRAEGRKMGKVGENWRTTGKNWEKLGENWEQLEKTGGKLRYEWNIYETYVEMWRISMNLLEYVENVIIQSTKEARRLGERMWKLKIECH